jgi:hypothetical protein
VSSTTIMRGSLGTTLWRTMSWPVRAVERQWMSRRSSPGTYSRSEWKAMPPWGEASEVGPSMSRARPVGTGSTSCTRGCTASTERVP